MLARRVGPDWEVWTPAKLNLYLEVLGRRDDGYHEIETLMVSIDLYDTLRLRSTSDGRIALCCRRAGGGGAGGRYTDEIPLGDDNLVVQAMRLLKHHADCPQGAAVRLWKRIPMAAGLGGGSSDAAAALWMANEAWGLGYSVDQLMPLAAQLGSDVPFFLLGGAAIGRGRGERLQSAGSIANLHVVVVRPPQGLATAAVYAAYRSTERRLSVLPLLESLQRGKTNQIGRWMGNGLQAAAETLSPWIAKLRDVFQSFDCLGHQMSGSGTSYFGICRHARHARRVAAALRSRGIGSVVVAQTCR